MTALTDLSALALTQTARAAGQRAAVDLQGLVTLAKTLVLELQALLKAIESLSSSTTAQDIANLAALTTISNELA